MAWSGSGEAAARSRSTGHGVRWMPQRSLPPARAGRAPATSAALRWRSSEPSPGGHGDRFNLDRPGRQRAGGTDPFQILAVWRIRAQPGGPSTWIRSPGTMAGYRETWPATARPGPPRRRCPRCRLVSLAWRPVAGTSNDQGPSPAGGSQRVVGPAGRMASRAAIRPAPITTGQNPATPSSRTELAEDEERRHRESNGGAKLIRSDPLGGDGRRWPRSRGARSGPSQRTVTRSLSFSNVFAPTSFRVRRSSTAANGCSSRDVRILPAVTGPIPERYLKVKTDVASLPVERTGPTGCRA